MPYAATGTAAAPSKTNRAARLVETMEEAGIVGELQSNGFREVLAPPPPSDLIRLLEDEQSRVRHRAALAVGRVGLAEGVAPLARLLQDSEIEVRGMAAFALGLIGDAAARPSLLTALGDADATVAGRAAEALGQIGDKSDAGAIGTLLRTHVAAGALANREPDDLTYPLPPATEAARLAMYALVRLAAYEPLKIGIQKLAFIPVATA